MISLVFWLLAAHFIGDYVLQSEVMALNKRRVLAVRDLQSSPVRAVPWYYWMAAHAFTHGALVAMVTGSPAVGILETVSHFLIDTGKCEGFYGLTVDQSLHIGCKVIWIVVLYGRL